MSTQIATAEQTTQVPTVVVTAPRVASAPTLRQFSVEKYHQMIESGVLTTNDRVQLIDGWIVEMPPIGPPHVTMTMVVEAILRGCLPAGWHVRQQSPITFDRSEPEPDIVVARGNVRDYLKRHPGPHDVALVIEVAESTLEFDRSQKLKIYAEASIPQYWIVNLADRQLEIHREPHSAATGAEYRQREVIDSSGSVNFAIDDKPIAQLKVSDLLP